MDMPFVQSTGTVPTPAVANTSLPAAQSLGNATARFSLSSYPRELLALPLRGLYQAETLAFSTIPRRIAGMATYLWRSGPATGPGSDAVAATTQAVAGVAQDGMADAADSGLHVADFLQAVFKFSGLFSYLTSRWSLACFTVGLVLNRITIYASTRRHLNLDWHRRLALRIIPIVLFITQIFTLLRAMRCQSSPDYPLMRYGTPGKRLSLDHAGGGGFLYSLASTLIPWETDDQSCSAVHMARPLDSNDIPYGSFAFLWPVFLRLCLSHFVETLSCALQGRVVVTEAGMSIFEHSLAFAEAESTISQSLGLGLFGLPKSNVSRDDSGESSHSALRLLSRAQVLERMNVTPELLVIALISCCNSLTSNILDVFGKQSRYRLLNTGFWGFCYMSAMAWGLMSGGSGSAEDLVLKFPTVCIVGFVPHLLILLGIIMCAAIYAVALFITAFSLPGDGPESLSIRQRLALAHENMQGSMQMHSIRLNRHDDFYTTLLRIGYTVLTAASEAVFLNEGQGVIARNMTWLEDERLSELESSRKARAFRHSGDDNTSGMGLEGQDAIDFAIPEALSDWETGYGKERKIEKPKHGTRPTRSQIDPGVGALRSAARYYHGFSFFRNIFYLLLRWVAYGLDKLLSKCGVSRRPQWLKKILGARVRGPEEAVRVHRGESLDFWILSDDGGLELPSNHEFDVETEMRKRERLGFANWEQADERRLDEKLYNWWKAGGSWGEQDQTPDFFPSSDDWDDTTSVVSMSTTNDSEWEDGSDGRRTPTQEDPYPGRFSRESTPPQESLMDISSFARLLDPQDSESRQEARILAAHLAAGQDGRAMTRRQFQQQVERDRAKVLLSRVQSRRSNRDKRKPTPEEEAEHLERLILSRRSESAASASAGHEQTWESGTSGLGPSGPPCVVCQTNPRSIITWPCRCLCVCEDCRVSLAMNNFGSCVTCRQEVGGFVRLWVP